MSTRISILYNIDQESGVKIHVYLDMLDDRPWIQIETPHACVTVPWPFGNEAGKKL